MAAKLAKPPSGEVIMSNELYWVAATILLTLLMAFPYVLNRMAVRGLMGAMANPSPADKPQADWARRAQAAHANAVENLVLFAPAAIAVHVAGLGNSMTAAACMTYFCARLAHYLVYAAGIPVLRTLAHTVGVFAILALILRLLGVL
jgi:uncharacterized MAPEG superfamily protein